jgi:hypothetical protein
MGVTTGALQILQHVLAQEERGRWKKRWFKPPNWEIPATEMEIDAVITVETRWRGLLQPA